MVIDHVIYQFQLINFQKYFMLFVILQRKINHILSPTLKQ